MLTQTLRDGLQSPPVRTPSIDQKIEILHHMEALGIDAAIGPPEPARTWRVTSNDSPGRSATAS